MDHVLNWLWQGGVVAGVTFMILRAVTRARAQFRYALCWIVVAVVLALPLVPVLFAGSPAGAAAQPSGSLAAAPVMFAVPDTWWTSTLVALAGAALWTFVATARMAVDLLAVRRARRRCRVLPPALASRLDSWTQIRHRGRSTRLMLSRDVRAAAMLGCGSPVIAVTPALVRHLSADELDRVVIHEWSHVQRRDDWLNVLQLTVKAIAGWHPAIWWLNRQLHIEREAASDEMTIAVTGSVKEYAASLARTASLKPARRHLVAAPGMLSSPLLRTRIMRILAYPRLETKVRSAATATTAAAAILGLAVYVGGLRLVGTSAPATTNELTSPQPLRIDDRATPVVENPRRPQRPEVRPSRPVSIPMAIVDRDDSPRVDPPAADSAAHEPAILETLPARSKDATLSVGSPLPVGAGAIAAVNAVSLGTAPDVDSSAVASSPAPWGAATDAGVSVGRASQKAAVATAGFFSRLGKKIAGSFENPR